MKKEDEKDLLVLLNRQRKWAIWREMNKEIWDSAKFPAFVTLILLDIFGLIKVGHIFKLW